MRKMLARALLGLVVWAGVTGWGCSESSNSKARGTQTTAPAVEPAQGQVFAAPSQAVDALVAALRAYDRDALARIFGPDAGDLIFSGDEIADRNAIETFLKHYDERHQLTSEKDGSLTLLVGENDWPVPIPIVKAYGQDGWYYDTEAGMEEIINRRVGRNELATIQVCLALVDAQREYAMSDADGDNARNYARKLRSTPGKRDGLYWDTAKGEAPSPMGPLVAQAAGEGYTAREEGEDQRPYHGYYYRLLTSQGPDAPGGARDYQVNGVLIGGFAVIAYPAEYGASGVMTFLVNQDGVVYQRDLGEDTEKLATSMLAFNPGAGWQRVDPQVAAVEP
jgi:hypothetical protein